VVDAGRREQRGGSRGQQADLVGDVDRPRVDVVRRDPHRVGVHRLVGEGDPLGGQRGQGLRDVEGPVRRRGRRLRGEVDVRGEPPHAVAQHPDREPGGVLVGGHDHPAVAQLEVLCAHAVHAQVGVLRPAPARGVEGGVGEHGAGQCEEVLVDRVRPRAPHGPRTYPPAPAGSRINRPGPTVR
jgi:hypothetical protein